MVRQRGAVSYLPAAYSGGEAEEVSRAADEKSQKPIVEHENRKPLWKQVLPYIYGYAMQCD